MGQNEIVCIGCPLGCHIILVVGLNGSIDGLTGNQCKAGRKYAIAEMQQPLRVFTTTLFTESLGHLLPVRTNKPVSRDLLPEIMKVTRTIKVKLPVTIGQEIVPNILGTGASLISTVTVQE